MNAIDVKDLTKIYTNGTKALSVEIIDQNSNSVVATKEVVLVGPVN